MNTRVKQASNQWTDEYASLLEAYVRQPSKDTLRQAAALGRSLFSSGVAPDEVAAGHVTCSERLRADGK